VIHFIYSNNLVSRKNEFYINSCQIFNRCFSTNIYPRYGTSESNINIEKKTNYMEEERIQFPKGKQKEFIKYAKETNNLTWKQFANMLGFSYNKIQNLWKENYRLSKKDFEVICNSLKIESNFLLEQFNGENVFWNNLIALSKIKNKKVFGKAIKKPKKINIKYKNNNLSLNSSLIKNNTNKLFSNIRLPKIICKELAYETGTSIGDGCIPSRGKSYRLKGNKNDEIIFYQNIIKPLFKKLYNIDVNLKEYRRAYGFEIYSKELINFKTKIIGLPMGSKKNIRIPNTLKIKNKEILCSLISGIFDTDGTIYFRSQGKNKNYYPTLRITTISTFLAKDIEEILKMLGFNVYIYKNNKINIRKPNPTFDIILDGYNNFKRFITLIGTKQPKNIDKINKWKIRWPELVNGWDSLVWSRIFGCGENAISEGLGFKSQSRPF
jgi:transcriptional regulator with XRE-family HTH domain